MPATQHPGGSALPAVSDDVCHRDRRCASRDTQRTRKQVAVIRVDVGAPQLAHSNLRKRKERSRPRAAGGRESREMRQGSPSRAYGCSAACRFSPAKSARSLLPPSQILTRVPPGGSTP